jgi:cellulose synthase/poly-beta-1,6-N-acetylglucosamine synthase-like glycosyltransferase
MVESVIAIVWDFIQGLIGFQLVFPVLLFLFYCLVKRDYPKQEQSTVIERDYAIIVTAYEQTDLLPAVIASILAVNYNKYLVYVVADKCEISLLNFNSDKVILLRPEETLASNTRSHFYAIDRFLRPHECLTIIDSDNLVEPNYLNQLNVWFDKGFKAVQGIREAKNLNTTLACLDAARDIYYHFYDGKVLFGSGSSATLAGSGMAFTTELYKRCLGHLDITGAGFDKVLQAQILNNNERIAFTMDAIVYDEKTANSDQLVNQRARWINTWFRYFKFGFKMMADGIIHFNRNKFIFSLVLVRPPLFMFLIVSVLFALINLITGHFFACLLWIVGLAIFVGGFLFALSRSHTDKKIYVSLVNIPKFMFYQFVSLLNTRKANKRSVATKHRTTT